MIETISTIVSLFLLFLFFYWIWSDNEKKKMLDYESQRKESEKQEYLTKLNTEDILIYQQFKSFFLKIFEHQELISKKDLNNLFEEKFKYYKNGDFNIFLRDLRNSGILSSIKYESEDFFLGSGFYDRQRNFENFEKLVKDNKPNDSGFRINFDGLVNKDPTYFYNENYEIHYGFNFNLVSYKDFNKLFEEKIVKTTSFFLVTYFDCFIYDIKMKEKKNSIIYRGSIEIKKDLRIEDYKENLIEWYTKYQESMSKHKESYGLK